MDYSTLPTLDADIVLQLRVDAPVSVGFTTSGNEAKMWRAEVMAYNPTGGPGREWRTLRIPGVPGASLRGVLRDICMTQYCRLAGLRTDNRDFLRLLFKGGKLDKSSAGIDLAQMHELRNNCPPLAIFGYMDNAGSARGLLQVEDIRAWTEEGVRAGVQARVMRVHGEAGAEDVALFPGLGPIPISMTSTVETRYRRDMLAGGATKFLGDGARREIEDQRKAVKDARSGAGDKTALAKDVRREANESMPWTLEAIPAGVPMIGRLRLVGATEIEYACLAQTIAEWARLGCPVGGKTASGFGKMQILRATTVQQEHAPGALNSYGRLIPGDMSPGEAAIAAYEMWVKGRAETIREWAGVAP